MPSTPGDVSARVELERRFRAELVVDRRRRIARQIGLNALGIVLFLALWEIAPRVVPGVNQLMFPPPSGVVEALGEQVLSGKIFAHIWSSAKRAVLGFIVGSTLGVVLGLFTGRLEAIRHLSDPVLHSLRSIPAIAFVPLSIVWLGIGELPKVALIAWGTFFPVWVSTFIGVRAVPVLYVRSASSLGAGRRQILFQVVLPAALPFVFAGLRHATATAFVILVAAEMVGASSGVGFLISFSHLVFRVDLMFVGLLALGACGYLADRVFAWSLTRIFPWYGADAR